MHTQTIRSLAVTALMFAMAGGVLVAVAWAG
jgi:hypothetical protein